MQETRTAISSRQYVFSRSLDEKYEWLKLFDKTISKTLGKKKNEMGFISKITSIFELHCGFKVQSLAQSNIKMSTIESLYGTSKYVHEMNLVVESNW